MNYKKQFKISDELQNVIINVAYGKSSFWERRKIYNLSKKNENVRKLLNDYSKTASIVHSIHKQEYLGSSKIQQISPSKKSIFDDIYLMIIGKPVMASIATVILIFALTFSFINNQQLTYEKYTISEVQKANIEAKQAFRIVNKIFNKTENFIRNDILAKEVSKPIKNGINTVDKLFKKETNDENHKTKL